MAEDVAFGLRSIVGGNVVDAVSDRFADSLTGTRLTPVDRAWPLHNWKAAGRSYDGSGVFPEFRACTGFQAR